VQDCPEAQSKATDRWRWRGRWAHLSSPLPFRVAFSSCRQLIILPPIKPPPPPPPPPPPINSLLQSSSSPESLRARTASPPVVPPTEPAIRTRSSCHFFYGATTLLLFCRELLGGSAREQRKRLRGGAFWRRGSGSGAVSDRSSSRHSWFLAVSDYVGRRRPGLVTRCGWPGNQSSTAAAVAVEGASFSRRPFFAAAAGAVGWGCASPFRGLLLA
jgi:hypothetical protein